MSGRLKAVNLSCNLLRYKCAYTSYSAPNACGYSIDWISSLLLVIDGCCRQGKAEVTSSRVCLLSSFSELLESLKTINNMRLAIVLIAC